MKVFKEHENVLLDLFSKDATMTNFNTAINPYLESFNKISETFQMQIEMVENLNNNIDYFLKIFPVSTINIKILLNMCKKKFQILMNYTVI